MAYLTKCPLCNRENVSSEATSCPGCGHNIAEDLRKKRHEEEMQKVENKILGHWEDTGIGYSYSFSKDGTCYCSYNKGTYWSDGVYTIKGDIISVKYKSAFRSFTGKISFHGSALEIDGNFTDGDRGEYKQVLYK